MHIRPINDTLLVKLDEDEWIDETVKRAVASGFVIPSEYESGYKKRSSFATVIAWGKKCQESYKVGDRLRFKIPSMSVKINDEEFRLILEHQILYRIENA